MIVRVIGVQVKEQYIDAFKAATAKNHAGSIREPGVLRFDVLQSRENPASFLLYEAYRDEEATVQHKETAHYAEWKETVGPMMSGDRTSAAYTPVAPSDEAGWISG